MILHNKKQWYAVGIVAVAIFAALLALLSPVDAVDDPVVLCAERVDRVTCWHDTLIDVLDNKGAEQAFDDVRRLYENDDRFAESCHSITHDLGIAAYRQFRGGETDIFIPEAAFCANGFYHGFMEGFIGEHGNPHAARELCAGVGRRLGGEAPDAEQQCHHGIGHGAVDRAIARDGTPTTKAIAAYGTEMCEQASDDQAHRYRCVSGVYNGIANLYIREELGITINTENPLELCLVQPDAYEEACVGNMNSVLFWMAGNDFEKTIPLIERNLASLPYAARSVRYLASLIAPYAGDDSLDSAVDTCRRLTELHTACIEGLAHGHLEHGTPGREYADALVFCATPRLTPHERDVCYDYALSDLGSWFPESRIPAICDHAPAPYQFLCQND